MRSQFRFADASDRDISIELDPRFCDAGTLLSRLRSVSIAPAWAYRTSTEGAGAR